MECRLAAILAADIVGYGRLMEADEVGTLTALKARHKTAPARGLKSASVILVNSVMSGLWPLRCRIGSLLYRRGSGSDYRHRSRYGDDC